MSYIVYVLVNTTNNKTYVGITNNPVRRIRQHNGELVGGAKYTKMNKDDGEWVFHGYIKNLEKKMALSIEKRIKIKSKRLSGTPIERRLKAINLLLPEYNEKNNLSLFFENNIV
jgi:predicted GIY-YIG superfamily endonuclease